MDYLCAKFGNFSFSRFGFIVRTESQRRMIAIRQVFSIGTVAAYSVKYSALLAYKILIAVKIPSA